MGAGVVLGVEKRGSTVRVVGCWVWTGGLGVYSYVVFRGVLSKDNFSVF